MRAMLLAIVVGLLVIGQSDQLAFIYEQCAGSGVSDTCDIGLACVYINQYYSQCLEDPSLASTGLPEWSQCGGSGYTGSTVCRVGLTCVYQNIYYSSCVRVRSTQTTTAAPTTSTAAPTTTTTSTAAPTTTTTTSTVAPTATTTAPTSQGAQVAEWGQCGGIGYTGSTTCQQGLRCVFINSYYSQCQRTQQSTTTTTTTTSTTTRGSTSAPTNRTFGSCNFLYGRSFTSGVSDYTQFDYITIWLGSDNGQGSTDFNIYWQGDMLSKATAQNRIPLFYAYIIAFEARNLQGLKDCDVGTPNLCQYGANFIRNNRAYLIGRYTHQASRIADYIGRNGVAIFLIEPDFWQYYGDTNQQNGPLSGEYMRALFDDFAKAIRDQLPNAIISWDISPWLSQSAMQLWWSYFSSSPYISFIHTSGGSSRPDLANIKPNELTWAFMSQLTGKKIIADCGYGVGGAGQNNCYLWSDQNILNSRIRDGVVALSQASSVYTPSYKPTVC